MKKRTKPRGESGYIGVSWSKQRKKWRARIVIDSKEIAIGFFQTPEEASEAYQEAYEKLVTPFLTNAHQNRLDYIKKWQSENKAKVKEYKKKYKKGNVPNTLKYEKGVRIKLKLEIINEYGGACQCCGENEPRFLAIDHINGNGSEHRKEIGIKGGYRFYLWLKENKYPKDNFQLLCMNCNFAKGKNGTCPHQERKDGTR